MLALVLGNLVLEDVLDQVESDLNAFFGLTRAEFIAAMGE